MLAQQNALFVPNEEAVAFANDNGPMPKLIVVADNPGAKERRHKAYLCREGKAGKVAREFFDAAFNQSDTVGSKVLVWNKSTYHTPRTCCLGPLMELESKSRSKPRSACEKLLRWLHADQKANGRLIARLAAASKAPVLIIGLDKKIFKDFFSSLEAEAKRLNVTSPIRKAPHFSRRKIFCRGSLPGWNDRLKRYLEGHSEVRSDKNNVSWDKLKELCRPGPQKAYLEQVILDGTSFSSVERLSSQQPTGGAP